MSRLLLLAVKSSTQVDRCLVSVWASCIWSYSLCFEGEDAEACNSILLQY